MRRLGVATLIMSAAVFLSRVIGYARDAYVAARFGARGTTDAFFSAFTLPDWLAYLVAGGTLSITFLPIYAKYLAAKDERGANEALSVVATLMLLLVSLGVLAGMALSRPFVEWFFHRMAPTDIEACIRYTRILFPAQLFFFAGGLMGATLLARGKFMAVAVAPLLYNVGIMAGAFFLGDRLGVESLSWGALAGAFAGPFLIPTVAALRAGARIQVRFAPRHPSFVEWMKLSIPLMLGVSLVTADDWVIRYFAGADEGAVTHLNYAKRLAMAAIAIAGQAVGQASMPFFARLFAEDKKEELADVFLRTLRGTGVVAMMAAAGMIALAHPVVDFLYGRGQYTAADVTPTSLYLAIFAAAVPLWAMQGITARLFYAARNTLTPMLAGTLVTVVSIPIYAGAFRWFHITGLAIASGIGILLHTLCLALLAPGILPELRGRTRPLGAGLLRGALLASLAGSAAHLVSRQLASTLPALSAGALTFAAVVLLLSAPLGIPEPLLLLRKLTRRGTV